MVYHLTLLLLSVTATHEILSLEDMTEDSVSLLQMQARRNVPLSRSEPLMGAEMGEGEGDGEEKGPEGFIPARRAARAQKSAPEIAGLFAGENHRVEGYINRSMMSMDEIQGYQRRALPEIEDGTWTYDVPRPVKIVAWTGQFGMDVGVLTKFAPGCTYNELPHSDKDITEVWGKKACCDWEYVISNPDTDISDVDVVLFYLPYVQRTDWRKSMPSKKKPGQLWIATCGEPTLRPETGMDCSLTLDEAFMEQIDGLSSFGPTEFQVYNDPPSEKQLRLALPDFASRGSELATFVSSDCEGKERLEWMESIMFEFKKRGRPDAVLSYGRCLHNAEEPSKECLENVEWFDGWSNRCSSRPFKFVAENMVESWYVTEKIWDAYWEGAIPIYWGPPEVKFMVPPNSMIYWQDYESPAALVEAMLSFTEADIHGLQAWRSLPKSEWGNYTEIRRMGHMTILPRICEAAAKVKVN